MVYLWPKRLIGDTKLPPERRPTKTNVGRFNGPKHQELIPSGLLGPVILRKDQ